MLAKMYRKWTLHVVGGSIKWCLIQNAHLPYDPEILLLGTAAAAAAAAESLQSCSTLCDPIGGSPPGSPRPWDSPGKNTGVGCHFLLQCMKVKSESEVAQSCPTLCDPMDCSLPGSSIHGIVQARALEWGDIAFSALRDWSKRNENIRLIQECS